MSKRNNKPKMAAIGVFICLLIFSHYAFPQKQIYIGARGGVNFSTVFFNHLAFPTNIRTALQTGTSFGVEFKHLAPYKKFAGTGLQFSFNYVEKGYIQEFPGSNVPNYSLNLRYLEIPFAGIFYIGKKKTKLFASPGIFAEFLLGSTSANLPADMNPTEDHINVGNSDVFPFDEEVDITIGAGGKAVLGILRDFKFGSIQLSGNFTYTITNILDFGTRSSGIPDTSNNLSFGASIGYFYKFSISAKE